MKNKINEAGRKAHKEYYDAMTDFMVAMFAPTKAENIDFSNYKSIEDERDATVFSYVMAMGEFIAIGALTIGAASHLKDEDTRKTILEAAKQYVKGFAETASENTKGYAETAKRIIDGLE